MRRKSCFYVYFVQCIIIFASLQFFTCSNFINIPSNDNLNSKHFRGIETKLMLIQNIFEFSPMLVKQTQYIVLTKRKIKGNPKQIINLS